MTLTQTAQFTKIALLTGITTLILGITGFTGYKIWYNHYLASLPKPEPKPDLKFGALPQPDLPQTLVTSGSYTYSLATTTGTLPSFDKLIKVYFMPKPTASFLAEDKTKALAQKLNISTDPQIVSDTEYSYSDEPRSLTVELDTGNFLYTNTATLSATQTLDQDDRLVSDFKSNLQNLNVLKEALGTKRQIELLKVQDNQLVPASSRAEAQAARIYLWPADIDEKPVLIGKFNKSLIYATAVGSAFNPQSYQELHFTYRPVDQTTFATYQIKPVNQAFDELKSGQGAIIEAPQKQQVSITSIYIAYYESEKYVPFLLPIFVFEGPGFVAYIPAIAQDTSQSNSATSSATLQTQGH